MNNPILNEVLDLEMVLFKHQRARELPSVDCGQTVKLQLGTLAAAEAMKGLELYRRVTDAIKMKITTAEMGYCY